MLLLEDTKCVEYKNHEYFKLNPVAVPLILLNESDKTSKGSPKLIHIAKSSAQSDPVELKTEQKGKTPVTKDDIGILGSRDGKYTLLETQALN